MDTRTLLTKCITLVYREGTLKSTSYDNESLVRTLLDTIKVDNNNNDLVFSGHNKIKELKEYVLELLADKTKDYDKNVMLPRLRLLLETDDKLYAAIEQGISPDYEESVTKRVIVNLVKAINNYYKESKIMALVNRANTDLRFNREKIPDVDKYIDEFISQLEPLRTKTTSKDPAVMNEVDLEDEDGLTQAFSDIKSTTGGDYIMQTGFQAINKMTQGGLRRGETVFTFALQHKYKSGLRLSLFAQLAQWNKPHSVFPDEGGTPKKPLFVSITFEDSLISNLQFIYQYLKNEDGITPTPEEITNLNEKEAALYIKSKLGATGFRIKMREVDPTRWTYKDICNYIIELEAQGFEIYVLSLDYLSKVPTTGCTVGPMGTDRRDQVRRMKNFCKARKIMLLTPHQLSTEAKQFLRNGVPEVNLVKEVAEKGYTEESKQLDQEIDLEIYQHLFTYKRKTYLALMRGKHRLPTNIDADDKFAIYQFRDKNTPLPADINGVDLSMKSLPKDDLTALGTTYGIL